MSNLDLENCSREPIHIPGSIQPYGVLLTFDDDLQVLQSSANAGERIGYREGMTVADLLSAESLDQIKNAVIQRNMEAASLRINQEHFDATLQYLGDYWILELEPNRTEASPASTYRRLNQTLAAIKPTTTTRQLAEVLVAHVRELAGFDRVMVYRFLEDESGVVVAEAKRNDLESYYDLHYPASDIPRQARALYLKNSLRLIQDVSYEPVPLIPTLNPKTGKALDMSDCVLRSVSPIHVQYLKNMEVGASMSMSLVVGDHLWGLIACHHTTAWEGGRHLREACDLIGQVASIQLARIESAQALAFNTRTETYLKGISDRLEQNEDLGEALQTPQLLDLVNATGAAIVNRGQATLIGATPDRETVKRMAETLGAKCSDKPFNTESAMRDLTELDGYGALASGVMAICPFQRDGDLIIWFRPEAIETISWAGDPRKALDFENRLAPRQSFEEYKQEIRGVSRPWQAKEVSAADKLRIMLLEKEMHTLNNQLELRVEERTRELELANENLNEITYSISHDLRQQLRRMVANSRILVEEQADDLTGPIRDGLTTIEGAALRAAILVDAMLSYARYGRQDMKRLQVDVSSLAEHVSKEMRIKDNVCRSAQIDIQPGLTAFADPALLEKVLSILIENGCVYARANETPRIQVGTILQDGRMAFCVRNEGIGFEMRYVDKIFQPFQRLHRDHEFAGIGIGLAIAKRIIERHGGTIWAEGRNGEGATFLFTLGS